MLKDRGQKGGSDGSLQEPASAPSVQQTSKHSSNHIGRRQDGGGGDGGDGGVVWLRLAGEGIQLDITRVRV